jgi:hypothetical protein
LAVANNELVFGNEDCEESKIALKTVLQVEFTPSLLLDREAVLKRAGYQVISVLGSSNARNLEISDSAIGVILIGHGAIRPDRQDLIAHFRETLPGIPIVALLRSADDPFSDVDFNCPADNPPLWERTVFQTLQRAEHLQ